MSNLAKSIQGILDRFFSQLVYVCLFGLARAGPTSPSPEDVHHRKDQGGLDSMTTREMPLSLPILSGPPTASLQFYTIELANRIRIERRWLSHRPPGVEAGTSLSPADAVDGREEGRCPRWRIKGTPLAGRGQAIHNPFTGNPSGGGGSPRWRLGERKVREQGDFLGEA